MRAAIAEKNVLAASQASGLLKALADPLRRQRQMCIRDRCQCALNQLAVKKERSGLERKATLERINLS